MPPVLLRRIPAPDSLLNLLHHSSPPLQPLSLRFASAPDSLSPTRTLSTLLGGTRVIPRQAAAHTTSTIPATYGATNGPDVGTVVGITLGSVAGFILLLWLIYTCLNVGNPDAFTDAESTVMSVGTASVGTRTRVKKHVHRHHRSPRRETVEIRTSGPGRPVIVEERGGSRVREVVVEDTVRRSASRARPPPRVVDEDEEIVVLEEHSPPRRHKSRRRSSAERRSGGYRVVREDEVVREVRRESGSRRR
ncbi:hypothetical protein CONLIGDRAFT_678532 [Coniochaeta ligniaria NRRL 30616]|uniref:Uncharacterized protein n=1 Tax=Coniochaeta ligniaria NRRL 30616 TaxID=1408157 RepID=A0A1J7IY59_9PEZI|nr:hypothetical protein CONLIGDRAFT_678532 [Coniochaeta ligniaria NRRL 30616]